MRCMKSRIYLNIRSWRFIPHASFLVSISYIEKSPQNQSQSNIIMSADTAPTLVERNLISLAERYCLSLSTEFADPARPTVEALNEITDDWIRSVALEFHPPSAVAFICMVCACCLSEDWISSRFGLIFWTLGFDTGRLTLFEYLLWRFEKYADECLQNQGISDGTGEFELDYGTGGEDYVDY
ncbi:hypothetical protein F5B21DRAFT_389193 [Xylaria acuta]|nr:hypothetical protein F5B21DRAFT_389193 [Xylaria acuta]